MKIVVAGQTDVGRKREKNEDSLLVDEVRGLYLVADGMGGHLGGEYASQMAVKTIRELVGKLMQEPGLASHKGEFDPGACLKQAIRVTSQKIFKEANRVSTLRGMGTTIVALLIQEGKGYIANVGDSRVYLVRNPAIRQLTVDHSLVSEQLAAGFITEAEVRGHRLKNIITRSVGFQDEVEIDLRVRDLEEGDCFLLCTDGLTNLVTDQEIHKIVSKGKSPKEACKQLIDLANQKGGDDNVTVLLVSVDKD